ncbi:MAG: TetR/AcrR family transcriptional regulator [Parvularculaceae bacterium]
MARPRSFTPGEAIAAVKGAFWREGFEGASMQDLEAATGLKKQSLYRQFGDKRAMYLAALEDYEAHEIRDMARRLEAPGPARARIEELFAHVIKEGDARGCFVCNASVDRAPLDREVGDAVRRAIGRMRGLFERALADDPAYEKEPAARAAKAGQLLAVYFGLRVMIKARAPEDELKALAKATIATI